jgi:hypothetical protein
MRPDAQPPELLNIPLPRILANRYRRDGLIAGGGRRQVDRAFDDEHQRSVATTIARRQTFANDDLLEEARRVAIVPQKSNATRPTNGRSVLRQRRLHTIALLC